MKSLLLDGADRSLEGALEIEQQAYAVHARSRDVREGLDAFRRKRQPKFVGR